jgi:hypothetical protein
VKKPQTPISYRDLVRRTSVPAGPPPRNPENELDSLIVNLKDRRQQSPVVDPGVPAPDRMQQLRELMANELAGVFNELAEKYASSGISMQMHASNFLQGGRELKLEFAIGDHRTQMHGTVTSEAIAFQETRHTPEIRGELVSGPMLRTRALNAETFRNFVCERLAVLLRGAMRRR